MTGYATSAKALEFVAGDTVEEYQQLERVLSTGRAAWKGALGVWAIGGMLCLEKLLTEPSGTAFMGTTATAVVGAYSARNIRAQSSTINAVNQVIAHWSERNELHPLQILEKESAFPRVLRYVPEHTTAMGTIQAYDTEALLQAGTNETHFGLINAVTGQQQKTDARGTITMPGGEEIAVRATIYRTIFPSLNFAVPGIMAEGQKAMIIGHTRNGRFLPVFLGPAIQVDDYYDWRDRRKRSKKAEPLFAGLRGLESMPNARNP